MMTMDMRALAACVLAGAVAAATIAPAETNWNALDSANWSDTRTGRSQAEGRSGSQSESGATMAQSGASSAKPAGIDIKQAFVKLGMAEARAACFGEVLAKQLSPEEQQEAAQLVGESEDADDVKMNVMSAGPTMVGGFSAADASCPDGMGG